MPTQQELLQAKRDFRSFTKSLKVKGYRPPCPECGGKEVTSHGYAWQCKKCNRKFAKIYRRPSTKTDDVIPSTEVIDLT